MDTKGRARGKDREPVTPGKEPVVPGVDDYRASAKHAIEQEVGVIIEEEIRNAAKELAEEYKMAIRAAVAENKQVIREVLEQEKLEIRARIETTRQSIVGHGMV